MASGKRASMREGPLAQLFRKTDGEEDGRPESREDRPRREEPRREEEPPRRDTEPRGGRPLPEGGPGPQATRHAPEPQAHEQPELRRAAEDRPRPASRAGQEREGRHWSRYEGIPTPEERLRSVFSADIPENILDLAPTPHDEEPEPIPAHLPMNRGVTEPVLRVVGVGGAGVNAVNRMIEAGVGGVGFSAVNTDMQSLEQSASPTPLHIGSEVTRGLGSGSNPDLGRAAAMEEYDRLKSMIKGADMVFITAGAGGGT